MNSLLSVLFSLAIGALALNYALPMLIDAQIQPAQNDAANQIATLEAATVTYILGNANTPPLSAITPGNPLVMKPSDFPSLILPATFRDFNVFGQNHAVVITQNSPGQFEALVYTYGGDTIPDNVAIRVAQAGPPNSVVYLASDPSDIEGASGGELIPIAQFQNTTHPITAGHIGAHILPASLAAEAPFLNRYATGNLDDNTMHTAQYMDGNDLNMAGGNVNAAKTVSATQQVNTPMVADPTTPTYQITMAGTSNIQNLTATGTITAKTTYSNDYLHTSDASLKTNIHQIQGALDLIKSMQGDRFQWIQDGSPSIGFIAQDVQRIFPEAVKRRPDGKLAVEYDIIAAPLVEAVKELSLQVEELRSENMRLMTSQDRRLYATPSIRESQE
jgi:hypothetical protein